MVTLSRPTCLRSNLRPVLVALTLPLVLLGACGGPAPDRPTDLEAGTACISTAGSWLLARTGRDDFAVDEMTPRLFSTRRESKPSTCPDAFEIESGHEGGLETMSDFFCRLGALDFGRLAATDAVSNEVSAAIAVRWGRLQQVLRSAAEGAGPLRLLVKHYPRLDVSGSAVTLQASAYTLRDLYLDHGRHGVPPDPDAVLHGVLLRVSKTYQLESAGPRLIEASIEVMADCRFVGEAVDYATLLQEPELLTDPERDAHFEDLHAGDLWGLCWVDLSHGRGAARPFTRSYHVRDGAARLGQVPAAWAEALLRLVERL